MPEPLYRLKINPKTTFTASDIYNQYKQSNPAAVGNATPEQFAAKYAQDNSDQLELVPPNPPRPYPNLATASKNAPGSYVDLLKNTVAAPLTMAAGTISAMSSPSTFTDRVKQTWDALTDDYKRAYGSPENFARTIEQDPARVMGDISALTGAGGSALRLGGSAGMRVAGTRLPLVYDASRVAKNAGVDLGVMANYTDPVSLAWMGIRRGALPATRKTGEALYNSMLKAPSDIPIKDVEAARKLGFENRVPVSAASVEKGGSLAKMLEEGSDIRTKTSEAATNAGYSIRSDEILDELAKSIDELKGGNLTERKGSMWEAGRKFVRDQTRTKDALDMTRKPSEQYPNPPTVKGTFDPKTGPFEITPTELNDYRAGENRRIRDAYTAAQNDENLSAELSGAKKINDVGREKLYDRLTTFDSSTTVPFTEMTFGKKVDFNAMGQKEKKIFDLSQTIGEAVKRADAANLFTAASPYYISSAVGTLASGGTNLLGMAGSHELLGASGVVAIVGALKSLYTKRPDLASKLAFKLAENVSTNPSLVKDLRRMATATVTNRSTNEPPAPSAPASDYVNRLRGNSGVSVTKPTATKQSGKDAFDLLKSGQ